MKDSRVQSSAGWLALWAMAYVGAPPALPGGLTPTSADCADPRVAINSANTPGDAKARFLITRPGSYYLSKDLIGEVGKSGIEIAASHVTIDLRGFNAVGAAGASTGIRVRGPQTNITIRDGSVNDWPGPAIDLSDAPFSTVEHVRAFANDSGIFVANRATVRACLAVDSRGGGILTGQASTVQDCIAAFNGGNGIYVLEASRVDECTLEGNQGNGIYLDGDGCDVTQCVALSNSLNGVASIYGASISQTTAEDNGLDGLWSPGPVIYTDCRVTLNGEDGIDAGDDSTITRCTAFSNFQDGFRLANRVTIADSHASSQRKGVGIHSLGTQVRIDRNHLVDNSVGLRVEGDRALIVRNTLTGNLLQPFQIAPGNTFGPFVAIEGAGDLGANAAAAHPLANLIY